MVSSLSSGSGVIVIFLFTGSPDRVSPLSRPGTRPGIRPVIHDHQLEGRHRRRGFPSPFNRRRSLLGHPSPAKESSPPHGQPAGPPGPDPGGISAFRTHELRSGWAPSVPRGRRCSPRPRPLHGRRPPLRSGQSLHPTAHPIDGDLVHEASTKGSRMFTRPIFPSPVAARMERAALRLSLGFAPRRPRAGQRTPERGQAIEHGPGTTRSTHIRRSPIR
jgi:hypothetical protein